MTLNGTTDSDIINGTAGGDIITTSGANGADNRFAQDIINLGVIAPGAIGNDIITDFDTNNFRGGENNFDTLSFTLNGQNFSLSTGQDVVNFVHFIENDDSTHNLAKFSLCSDWGSSDQK